MEKIWYKESLTIPNISDERVLQIIGAFLVIVLIRMLLTLTDFLFVRKYLKRYLAWTKEMTSDKYAWLEENQPKLKRLTEQANLLYETSDAVPMGYGLIANRQIPIVDVLMVSQYTNSGYFLLLRVKGYYKERFLENFRLDYWLRTLIKLPEVILDFAFNNPPKIITKASNIVYWVTTIYIVLKNIFMK